MYACVRTLKAAAIVAKNNDELPKGVKNLHSPQAMINCKTCHRGEIKPSLKIK